MTEKNILYFSEIGNIVFVTGKDKITASANGIHDNLYWDKILKNLFFEHLLKGYFGVRESVHIFSFGNVKLDKINKLSNR